MGMPLLAFNAAKTLFVEGYGCSLAAVDVGNLLSVEQILTSDAHPVADRGVKRYGVLKNMHRMTEIPPEFSEPLFERLFLLAEIGNFTPDEMRQYYNSLENMGDYDNIIHTAQEEAEKRGLEKGRAEGRTEAQEEMARKLKALGVDIDTIIEATGMDRDVVVNL